MGRLMTSAQDGDREAYAALLHEIDDVVRRIIRGRSPYLSVEDVEDRVQDVLLSVHEARATYDPARPFMPWLMAIIRNRMADEARRYARRASNEVAVDEPPETFPENRANSNADALTDSMALRDAIETLPSNQRRAIELLKLWEMSLSEASNVTGMSVAALKTTVHRAIKQLRRTMGYDG